MAPAPRSPRLAQATLVAVVFMFPLVQLGTSPGLIDIGRRFGEPPDATVWVMSAFLLASAIFAPLIGCLGDAYGKRRLLVATLVLVVLGSVLAALAPNLGTLVAGRALQGAVAGVFPLGFALTRELLHPLRHAQAIGLLTAVTGLGAGVALLLGGVLVDGLSFRGVLWFNGACAAITLVAVIAFVREPPVHRTVGLDIAGAALLAAGVLCIMLAANDIVHVKRDLWLIVALLIGGLALLIALVTVERHVRRPLINIPLFATPGVLATNLAALLVNIGGFSVFVLVPQFAQARAANGGFGTNATVVGLLLLPGAALMLLVGPAVGALGRRTGHRITFAAAAALVAIGTLGLATRPTSIFVYFAFAGVAFIGLNTSFAAMTNLIISLVPDQNTGEATGANSLVRTVGNAIGAQLGAAIVASSVVVGDLNPITAAYSTAFVTSAVISAVGGLVILVMRRRA